MNRHKLLPTVSVLAGVTLLAVAVAAASESDSDGTPVRSDRVAAPTTTDRETMAHFGIFRRPRTAADEVAMGRSSGMMVAEHGIALDLARRLVAVPGGSKAWIMPSADGLCLLVRTPGDRGPGGGCGTGRELFTQGAISTLATSDGTTELIGLVPDGVSRVQVHFNGGANQDVPVSDNGYYARDSRSVTKVTFTGDAGEVTIDASPGG